MDGENETVEGVVLDDGNSQTLVVDLPDGEGEGENTVETELTRVEEIRAETTIAVAAIEAGVEEARIEADKERNATWQEERIAQLETSLTELKSQLEETATLLRVQASLSPPSIPTPPLEVVEEAAETAAETALEIATVEEPNLTPEFTPDPINSTETELSESDQEESPVVAAVAVALEVPKRARRRAI